MSELRVSVDPITREEFEALPPYRPVMEKIEVLLPEGRRDIAILRIRGQKQQSDYLYTIARRGLRNMVDCFRAAPF